MTTCHLNNRLYFIKLQKLLTLNQMLIKYRNYILKVNKPVLFIDKNL